MIAKLFKKVAGGSGQPEQPTTDSGARARSRPAKGGQGSGEGAKPKAAGGNKGQGKHKASANKPGKSGDKTSSKGSKKGKKPSGKKPAGNAAKSGSDQSPKTDKPPKKNGKKSGKKGGGKKGTKAARKPWDISQFPVPEVEGKTRFHDFGLETDLMHAIADQDFQYCSPIQAQSLPYALQGKDVVGKAQTGTGKTAAFLAAIIDDLLKHELTEERYAGEARALIIAPTRELVMQIADDAKGLCKYTGLEIHTLVGGMDYTKQQRRLHDTLVDILVATPGRLLDFCRNKDVFLDQLEIMVIDEADRMLDMGFIPQVRQIVRQTPMRGERQTLFFSATFTEEVHRLVDQWTQDPVTVDIEPESVATDTVDQHVYLAATEEKYTLLYNLIQDPEMESMIVFANRRDECRRLQDKLQRHDIKVGLLSGEIAQNKRVKTLNAFKSGDIKVLVATDVAGRGIHIDGISHVVNYTLPEEPEDYVHRIGRTGRAGKTGTSISFACEDDAFRLMPIQELLGSDLRCEQPPEALLAETPPMAPPTKRNDNRSRGSGERRGRSGGGQRRSRPS